MSTRKSGRNSGGDQSLTAFVRLTDSRTRDRKDFIMVFFTSAVGVLQTLVIALGAGLDIWGVVNLMEGYGNDNPGVAKFSRMWLIPKDAEKPTDKRRKKFKSTQ